MNNFHHGNKLRLLTAEKGLTMAQVAEKRGVTKQAVTNDFARESIGLRTLKSYCDVFGVELNTFLNESTQEETKENKSNDWNLSLMKENNELRKEIAGLWRIIALSGIKVEKSQLNFNLGVSVSVLGNANNHIFFDK